MSFELERLRDVARKCTYHDAGARDLEKKVLKSQQQRDRQNVSGNGPTIVFRKSDERKDEGSEEAQNSEASETAQAGHPEGAKETPRKRLSVQVDDKIGLTIKRCERGC